MKIASMRLRLSPQSNTWLSHGGEWALKASMRLRLSPQSNRNPRATHRSTRPASMRLRLSPQSNVEFFRKFLIEDS